MEAGHRGRLGNPGLENCAEAILVAQIGRIWHPRRESTFQTWISDERSIDLGKITLRRPAANLEAGGGTR